MGEIVIIGDVFRMNKQTIFEGREQILLFPTVRKKSCNNFEKYIGARTMYQ
jgi:hypothetical protein